MLSSLFDEYSLNARVRPALLALLPLVVFAYLIFPQLYDLIAGAVSLFVIFGLVTIFAHFCRNAGRSAEQKLFKAWGGKPTTIMLRHSDTYLEPITKERYHRFLAKNIDSWVAPSVTDEMLDHNSADKKYDSAVRWLLEYTRDQKKYSILFKENISYGFRRNCYGIKMPAAVLAISPFLAIVADFVLDSISYVDIGAPTTWISLAISALLFFWWFFVVSGTWVKDAANGYATRLLAACESDGRS